MQICYNVRMSIFTYFKRIFSRRKERKAYESKKKKYGVSFPLYCKAHGVKKPDYQGAIVQSNVGDRLQLIHRAEENYPYNVYINNVELNRILGYLKEPLSKTLVLLFGEGFCRDGLIKAITGGGKYPYRGCNIVVLESMRFMKDMQPDLPYLHS